MSTAMHELTIRFADLGDIARVELPDPRSEEAIGDLLRRASTASVQIEAAEDSGDTMAHSMGDTVAVLIRADDDTEAHALSLRFPSADEAKAFQKRLLMTGAVAATIAVGAATAQLAGQGAGTTGVAPAPAPGVVAPAPGVAPGLAGEIKGGQVTPAQAPSFDRGAAAKQGPTVQAPSFDRGAAAKQGPTVDAPSFDRGAAIHAAGKGETLPDGWQTSRRHFPQASSATTDAPTVAPGIAGEIKGGDMHNAAAGPAAETAAPDASDHQAVDGEFRGR